MRLNQKRILQGTLGGLAFCVLAAPASAGFLVTFDDGTGLSAEASFSVSGDMLTVSLRNTSTMVPTGFSNSDQILTALSWDFGHPGYNGDASIMGGTVMTGASSFSMNFDIMNVGPNTDVSGEWGFGNEDGTGLYPNFITATQAHGSPLGGANLDGTDELDGPQGGLISPYHNDLGGLGAIQDEIIASLMLDEAITQDELRDDLIANGSRIEFGSDAHFIEGEVQLPAPAALSLLALAGLCGTRRRRS